MNHTRQLQPEFTPARRIANIGVSAILQITARAATMRRSGLPVISLGTGEPDFDTPEHIKQAAAAAMAASETKYTALDGTPELKQAIRTKFLRENGVDFGPDEITAATGAKQIIYNAMMASLDEGDEFIIPTSYWTTYSDIMHVAGGVPVLVPCDAATGFKLDATRLTAAITSRTRWLMLNSPSNPSGAAYGTAEYRPLLDVLLANPRVWLIADDIYEQVIYDGFRFVTPVALEPQLRARTLTVNGVSKTYAMTGWRLGYAAGPAPLIRAMAVVQSQSTSCPSSVSQAAAVAALEGPQDFLMERRRTFQRRRDMVVNLLSKIDGISCRLPESAFYAFPSCSGVLGRSATDGRMIASDTDFCNYLLDDGQVAVVPGAAFGLSPFFCVSYATSEEQLCKALGSIEAAYNRLRK